MRTLESVLRNVERPLPDAEHAHGVWAGYLDDRGYATVPSLMGSPSSNAKLSKGDRDIHPLSLMPHTHSGVANVCPFATDGCSEACNLVTAGRSRMSNVQSARILRTEFANDYPAEFLSLLLSEIEDIDADDAIRLNTASDIRWEYVLPEAFDTGKRFYDYTKWPIEHRNPPSNYRIVYSRNERDGDDPAVDYVRDGGTAAVVFDAVPDSWKGLPVIDGDAHDDRTADPEGVVIGLSAKGDGKHDDTGFVVHTDRE